MTATATQFASEAMRLLTLPEIPYRYSGTTLAGMDCQGAVKYCAQQIGVKLNYTGSNDMYRNACSWVGTLAEARAQRRVVVGAVGFIVEYDGQEGEQYQGDGMGNASHVGIITLSGNVFSVDASSSAAKVRGQTERDALRTWTHIGWLKALDYVSVVTDEIGGYYNEETRTEMPMINASTPASTLRMAKVFTPDGGNLNLRRSPSDAVDNRIGRAPFGASVEVLENQSDGWTKVKYESITAWVRTKYLSMTVPTSWPVANPVATAPLLSIPAQQDAMPQPAVARTTEYGVVISLSDAAARELHNVLDIALFG